ncbi:hypothetical protein BH10PSE4_BH10PSE4_33580 [soil metagenome]
MIRRAIQSALAGAVALGMTAASLATFWTPASAQVARLETLVKPKGPARGIRPISRYDRAYAGTTMSGRQIIEGRWVDRGWSASAKPSSPKIVPYGALPDVLDGGCDIVTVMYDVSTDKIVFLACNGVA